MTFFWGGRNEKSSIVRERRDGGDLDWGLTKKTFFSKKSREWIKREVIAQKKERRRIT